MERSGCMSGTERKPLRSIPDDNRWRDQGSPAKPSRQGSVRPLSRAKGLRRVRGLKRTAGLLRRAYNPSARTSLRPASRKRQRANRVRRQNLEEAWGPRPWVCSFWTFVDRWIEGGGVADLSRAPRCAGAVNAHELVKRSRGGSITDPGNCVPLCNVHNDWAEDNPIGAGLLGLVK